MDDIQGHFLWRDTGVSQGPLCLNAYLYQVRVSSLIDLIRDEAAKRLCRLSTDRPQESFGFLLKCAGGFGGHALSHGVRDWVH